MVAQEDLKYVWQVRPDSMLIRWYAWLYEAETTKLTFCKLFWATIFSPLTLIFKIVMTGMLGIGKAIKAIAPTKPEKEEPPPATVEELIAAAEARRKVGPSRGARWGAAVAGAVATGVDHVVATIQLAGHGVRVGTKPVRAAVRPVRTTLKKHPNIGVSFWVGVVLVVSIAVLGAFAFGMYSWASFSLGSLIVVLELIAFVTVIGGVAIGVAHLINARTEAVGKALDVTYDNVLTPMGHGFTHIGHFFAGIGAFFAMGYYVIKTRTCPRVEVVEEPQRALQ